MKVTIDRLTGFCHEVFLQVGLSEKDAQVATRALVTADTWGVHTHGVKNLGYYINRLLAGGLQAAGIPHTTSEGPAWVQVNGDSSLGMVASTFAMREAMRKAATAGIGFAGLCNSCHFGAAGIYASLAIEEGMIGIAMCNDTPTVTAPGSRTAVMGSNPIAYAIPLDDEFILLDIATSTVSGGKVFAAAAADQSIPDHWIVNEAGQATSDPALFPQHAALTPMTAHKGFGFALLVETLSAAITGAAMTHQVLSYVFDDATQPTGHGAAFLAIQIKALMPESVFQDRMQSLARQIRSAPRAEGVQRIYLPGEKEQEHRIKALHEGIQLPTDVVANLTDLSARIGVKLPG